MNADSEVLELESIINSIKGTKIELDKFKTDKCKNVKIVEAAWAARNLAHMTHQTICKLIADNFSLFIPPSKTISVTKSNPLQDLDIYRLTCKITLGNTFVADVIINRHDVLQHILDSPTDETWTILLGDNPRIKICHLRPTTSVKCSFYYGGPDLYFKTNSDLKVENLNNDSEFSLIQWAQLAECVIQTKKRTKILFEVSKKYLEMVKKLAVDDYNDMVKRFSVFNLIDQSFYEFPNCE